MYLYKIMAKKSKSKKMKKVNYGVPDTSRCKSSPAYMKANDLKVEESIQKDKEVKEKDVFDFSSKKK
jgi:hypothetical protein